jgi:CRISPR-associated protein Cas1
MIAKTLSFGSPGKLTVKDRQLVYDGEGAVHRTFPIEDLGFVIIETGLMTISSSCIRQLAENNVALVVCDGSHTPSAQMLPFSAHTTAHETVAAQIAASDAVNGRLWRQIVKAKIRNQAILLKKLGFGAESRRLDNMSEAVKNRDVGNLEAQAARIYFQTLSRGTDFVRDKDGPWPNPALNYGYAVLRAAVARALVGSGLNCILGIHHHNRYNAFCLADDVMEPYRPFVDQYVFREGSIFMDKEMTLTKEIKTVLLSLLTCDVAMGSIMRPLSIALTFTTASLAKYYLGKTDMLVLPEFVG